LQINPLDHVIVDKPMDDRQAYFASQEAGMSAKKVSHGRSLNHLRDRQVRLICLRKRGEEFGYFLCSGNSFERCSDHAASQKSCRRHYPHAA
jgi:hypothetical protein